jgi:hypothetical protein
VAFQLVVKHPFAGFNIGDHITDPALVAEFKATRLEYVTQKFLEESDQSASSPSAASPASQTAPKLTPIV